MADRYNIEDWIDERATYQITVKGKVAPELIKRFNDFTVVRMGNSKNEISNITGLVQDQEALSGVINLLINQQYTVLSVMKMDV